MVKSLDGEKFNFIGFGKKKVLLGPSRAIAGVGDNLLLVCTKDILHKNFTDHKLLSFGRIITATQQINTDFLYCFYGYFELVNACCENK